MGDDEKDSICNSLIYTLFPSSNIGVQYEIKKINKDLDELYSKLTKAREVFATDKRMYDKLKDKKILMDPNGMSRRDAIRSVLSRLKKSKDRIESLETQIHTYEKSRDTLESSNINSNMEINIEKLRRRIERVKGVDADKIVKNIDDIAEKTKELKDTNDKINDAMVSGWEVDMETTELELEEYMKNFDDDDLEIGQQDNNEFAIEEDENDDELVIQDCDTPQVSKPTKHAVLF